MNLEQWLAPERLVLAAEAPDIDAVVAAAARVIAPATDLPPETIAAALTEGAGGGGFAIGDGVAVPHAEVEGLAAPVGALVVTREPIGIGAVDGVPADIFFVVVAAPGDPTGHLLLLAHLAGLAHSRVLRAGLRRVTDTEEAWALLEAASLRRQSEAQTGATAAARPATDHYLAVLAIAGEQAVDALLVALLDQGFDDASIVEAQTLHDAATTEVPLFAGFREVFGDPGGRRVFLVEVAADRRQWLLDVVQRTCEERRAREASVSIVPLSSRWRWRPPSRRDAPASTE
jgi:nitrogen PTS system EIIA component